MSKPFNHFVITRFNLRQSIWGSDKKGVELNNNIWLKNRYDIFEKYCFPSMRNQTNLDFKWLVFFDETTPQLFREKNINLNKVFSQFTPIYVKDFEAFHVELPEIIETNLEANFKYVITTRLDNDDCFHKDAISVIQEHFTNKKRSIIDLSNGLTLQVSGEYKLALRKNVVSGPFISLCENLILNEPILTVYNREHTSWVGVVDYIPVKNGFYWLQIIHDRNVSNALGNQLTYKKAYLDGFDFLENITFSFRYYIFILYKKLKKRMYQFRNN
ncbi:glycosyltransferase [Seonamhaeicola maritimus]|uniref:Rhamnosyl transferase n=1 Tax=Seonamhaeicola maritimus TaxID=2591822 RepID=A0A5C7GKQ6_9FLAO|nr:glycosyltransferase [Seonamhaeicola maritimus]TXG38852.1 hypothetical protein FUA22_02895 [Seonamhaeicola maritimus]